MPFVQLKSTPPPPYAIKNHQKLKRFISYLSESGQKGLHFRNRKPEPGTGYLPFKNRKTGGFRPLRTVPSLNRNQVLVLISSQDGLKYWYWFRYWLRHESSFDLGFDFDSEGPRVHMLVSNPNQPVSPIPGLRVSQYHDLAAKRLKDWSIVYFSAIFG